LLIALRSVSIFFEREKEKRREESCMLLLPESIWVTMPKSFQFFLIYLTQRIHELGIGGGLTHAHITVPF